MRIVFGTPRVPYPPTDGGKIVMLNSIRHLAEQGHQIHVVSFAKPTEGAAVESLRRYCASVRIVGMPRLSFIRGMLGEPPATLARYATSAMRDALLIAAKSSSADIIELETLHMAIYGAALASWPRLLRPHNAEHLLWDRYAAVAGSSITRPFLVLQARRVRPFEARA